jgi:hypothetical protein
MQIFKYYCPIRRKCRLALRAHHVGLRRDDEIDMDLPEHSYELDELKAARDGLLELIAKQEKRLIRKKRDDKRKQTEADRLYAVSTNTNR